MNDFIKLTRSGDPIWVRKSAIVAFEPYSDGTTRLILVTDAVSIEETPDQLMALMEPPAPPMGIR